MSSEAWEKAMVFARDARELDLVARRIVDAKHERLLRLAEELSLRESGEAWADPQMASDGKVYWACFSVSGPRGANTQWRPGRGEAPVRGALGQWSLGVGTRSSDKDGEPQNLDLGVLCFAAWDEWCAADPCERCGFDKRAGGSYYVTCPRCGCSHVSWSGWYFVRGTEKK